jgi:arylsulfatase A-like enzyme
VALIYDMVGMITDALKEQDLLDDPVVVFTGEHGDLLGRMLRSVAGGWRTVDVNPHCPDPED